MSETTLAAALGTGGSAGRSRRKSPVSFFEFWPGWLFYAPVVAFWIAKSIRYGSVTLPALANPRIDAGGICGESKNDILDLAGPFARAWIADWDILPAQHLRTACLVEPYRLGHPRSPWTLVLLTAAASGIERYGGEPLRFFNSRHQFVIWRHPAPVRRSGEFVAIASHAELCRQMTKCRRQMKSDNDIPHLA